MSLWGKKMDRMFKTFDTDKDGVLSVKDFQLWADRLVQAYPSATEEQKKIFRQSRMDIWINFVNGGKSPAPGTVVTPEQFMESMRAKLTDAGLRGELDSVVRAVYDAMNTDKDGAVSREEFAKAISLFPNITAAAIDAAFNAIDKNKDNVLQVEEYLDALFFFVTDKKDASSPLNILFGNLE